ncbi:hypothetical protein N1851_023887 [Merluccius polli]|uniref:Ig-like domain-containing protein n=1 Tax=Merluccius polli TaxID=89951 RepID=A0AA47NUT7_MERPO|nr:hypothetical protein N1851_023887 [Merluccius polli]
MLHTAIPQLQHVTYSFYLNYHMLHTAIPQLPHVTYSFYLNYHIPYSPAPPLVPPAPAGVQLPLKTDLNRVEDSGFEPQASGHSYWPHSSLSPPSSTGLQGGSRTPRLSDTPPDTPLPPTFQPSVQSEGKPPLAVHSSVALPCSCSTVEGGRRLSVGCTTPTGGERRQDSELSLNTPETVATMNPLSLLFWTVVCGSLTGTSSQTVTQTPVASVTPGSSVTLSCKTNQAVRQMECWICGYVSGTNRNLGEAPKLIIKMGNPTCITNTSSV